MNIDLAGLAGTPTQEDMPLRKARTLADIELRQRATPDEVQWLRDNPLLWLRALSGIVRDVDAHLRKSEAALKAEYADAGTSGHQAYLAALRVASEKKVASLHVRGLAHRRIDEVESLCGPGPLIMTGHVVRILLDIADLIADDDGESAAATAVRFAQKLTKEHRKPAPDNRTAGAVDVQLRGMRPGRPISCRACDFGKVDATPGENQCTRCGQPHRITTGSEEGTR